MRVHDEVACHDFPCLDTRQSGYLVPNVEVDPERISIVLISEAAPEDPADGYYARCYCQFRNCRNIERISESK